MPFHKARKKNSSPPTPTYKTMTVKFDLTNSNPDTWGTYYDDAVGMTVGSDDWDAFFGHYPCVLENGVELGKLKRNNFSQYEDGTTAPHAVGDDIMICFPRRGIKLDITNNILTVSMTDDENVSGYSYMAHSYKGNPCSKFYLGAYKALLSNSRLYSISGLTPSTDFSFKTFRECAQTRGTGYEQSGFFQLTYRQVMYLLKYKGRNSQIIIGRGYSDSTNSGIYGACGYTDQKGMDWGESTGKYPMKLFGLEDFYGNISEFIEGLYSDTNRQIKVADGNFNNYGSGYTDAGTSVFSSNIVGYTITPNGTNLAGFIPASTNYGSATTFFCDRAYVGADRLAAFGGTWNDGDYAGVFRFDIDYYATSHNVKRGARLMYMAA